MLDTLSFQPSLDLTDWLRSLHARLTAQTGAWLCVVLRPIPRCARDQHCVLSCTLRAGRSSLQGATLRRRRFAPDTRLDRPSVVFNCGF